jgi:phosphoribosylaminoimidazole-succinocarboxamide synthase
MNDKVLAMVQTNRLSAFDRNISQISDKGAILTKTSEWWFNKLEAELNISHHHLYTHDNVMFVKKCNVIPLEVVIRDYMTGSTKTSLWTHYKNGSRNYSGNLLRDGYVKNQKLDNTIVTPTTKGVVDVPISETEILEQNIVSKEQWDYMKTTALKVFHYGSKVARERGLILVDTKYEFGFDENGDILLIDEVHTCDSSRFWKLDTYKELFNNGQEPKKFDKDIIRDYVKKQYDDPYKDQINIPDSMKKTTRLEYIKFYETLTEAKFSSEHITRFNNKLCNEETINLEMIDMDYLNQLYSYYFPCCVILSGSDKDEKHVNKIKYELQDKNIHNVDYICSAHKNTEHLLKLINNYEASQNKIIYITVAGKSDALSGVVSANARFPVIACPPHHNKLDMLTNLNSTLQCPSYVPVMTCLNPINVALCCKKILAFI